ncbi:MAG: SHOCT domain-containing protein [Micrococcales bacterium]|nr:SHOCT domain-containing protein [Micrococcales bacterium]
MPGLIRGVARTAAIAGTATAVSNGVSRRQYGRWEKKAAQQEAQQAPAQPAPAPAAPAPAAETMDDKIAALKQLGELHAQGILTDEEFAAQKAKLLG